MVETTTPTTATQTGVRSWRPLRIMIVVTLVLITLQVALGEIVGAGGNYPSTGTPINSIGDLITAMSNAAGPMIFVHVGNGLLILIAALGTLFLALRYHKRSETTAVVLGFVAVILALLGGYVFADSDFQNGGGIILMVNSALGAYAFFFLALYYTK